MDNDGLFTLVPYVFDNIVNYFPQMGVTLKGFFNIIERIYNC